MGSAFVGSIVKSYNFFRPPKFSGEVKISKEDFDGLSGVVKIIFDKNGAGHIYGKTKLDVFFGQGFYNAQQRLIDIDIKRRIALGRIAEVKPEALSIDRVSRTLGFSRIAKLDEKNLNKNNKRILNAFVAGLNCYLTSNVYRNPIENVLGYPKVEKFTNNDILSILRMMIWQMNDGFMHKVVNIAIEEFFGENAGDFDFNELCSHDIDVSKLENLISNEPIEQNLGSNLFIIHGDHTESGKPILENDAHLVNNSPSIWLQTHLICDDFNVSGLMLAGLPGIFSGFNSNGVAFGVTNSIMDSFDLYIQKLNDKNEYFFEGEWKKCEIITEEIKIKGKSEPLIEKILVTNNGPIISNVVNFQKEKKVHYSLKGLSFEDFGNQIIGFIGLCEAKNTTEAIDALGSLKQGCFNMGIADSNNDISLFMIGNTPKRTKISLKNAGRPYIGWEKEYSWIGFHEEPKIIRNPKQGFLIACNNDIFKNHGIEKPFYLSNVFGGIHASYRANRIKQLIQEKIEKKIKFSNSLCNEISNDITQFELPNKDLMQFVQFKKKTADNRILMEAKKVINQFDGCFSKESFGASLYEVFSYEVFSHLIVHYNRSKNIKKSETEVEKIKKLLFGNGVSDQFLFMNSYMGTNKSIINHLLGKFDETKKKEIVKSALNETVERLLDLIPEAKKYKIKNPKKSISLLNWGKIHKNSFPHAIPGCTIRFESGGNWTTPKLEGYPRNGENFDTIFSSSMKSIVDLSNIENSKSIIYPGNSSIPFSQYFDDCVDCYKRNQVRDCFYKDKDIENNKIGIIAISQ